MPQPEALLDTDVLSAVMKGNPLAAARAGEYLFLQEGQIWFLTVYGKDEAADLTASEKRLLKTAVDQEKQQRAKRRTVRRK